MHGASRRSRVQVLELQGNSCPTTIELVVETTFACLQSDCDRFPDLIPHASSLCMPDSDSFDDDSDEYELEPVDPEILEMERQRVREQARRAELAVDINESYDDAEHSDPISWDDFKGFRFTTRHLLIATAGFALLLTLFKIGNCLVGFLLATAAVGAGWYYVFRKERLAARERQRERVERRRELEREHVGTVDYSEFDEPEQETTLLSDFRFNFSMKQLLGAMTIAAVTFTLMGLLGGENLALILGLIALIGLIVHVVGFEVPMLMVLCWWMILVLYIIVSIFAILTSGGDTAALSSASLELFC